MQQKNGRFECDKCGACCTGKTMLLEVQEIDLIREPKLIPVTHPFRWPKGMTLVDAETEEPVEDVIPGYGGGGYLIKGPQGCPMLNDNLCTIYPTRPNCCVGFQPGSEQCQIAREYAGLPRLTPVKPKAKKRRAK